MSVVILASEAAILLTNVAMGRGQFFWTLATVALVNIILLRAMYRGPWLAQRIMILGLGVLFVSFLVVAY
jgi:hypothetical protein